MNGKPRAAVARAAFAGLIAITVCSAAAAAGPRTGRFIPARGAGPTSLADAQKRADFVIYLPGYLPDGAGERRIFFAPEQVLDHLFVPNRVYTRYGGSIYLWQMPALGRPLRHPAFPVSLGGRIGWASDGPGKGKSTLEWQQGETQLGITAVLPLDDLFKIAGSAVQAAPDVPMARPSPARLEYWRTLETLAMPEGGIGVSLAPGTPPTVLSLEPGAPAADAGIHPGDVIIAVNGRDVTRLPVLETTRLVRGATGTTVTLTIARQGTSRPIQVRLRREPLPNVTLSETTPAQAGALMPFPLLEPRWLPSEYRLLTCMAATRDGKPWEARFIYIAAGQPLILISETDARTRRITVPSGKGTQQVSIGGAVGTLSLSGGLALAWTQHRTAILLQSRSLQRDVALKIARSMK
jgi:membrane-associated protease RseP (regulator of RpoE activity)